ncbi:hypothetical protein [Niastella vici]|uniref:hypothetical protein n=1 Tax=Niastella vici TaxID=1703345 RepID=UPI001C1F6AB0|nr:hypothetical protein [Niastella vici]
MTFSPFFRKLTLTTHITFSIGWVGAVASFLAIAIAGLVSQNAQMARSLYLALELVGWYVIVPFCLASLLTGLVESLGTPWGFFRYYWIVVKLFLTIAATVVLLVHMQLVSHIANTALLTTFQVEGFRSLRIQFVADAGAALLVLLAITAISVYKPWGRTRYGVNKENEQRKTGPLRISTTRKPWGLYVLIGMICLVILLFAILHLTGVMGGH